MSYCVGYNSNVSDHIRNKYNSAYFSSLCLPLCHSCPPLLLMLLPKFSRCFFFYPFIAIKKGTLSGPFIYYSVFSVSTDARCGKCHRSGLSSSKVEGEVVCVTFVHDFHTQTSTVKNVCPSVEDTTLTIKDGLVEVETVQVECHGANTKSSEPDANNSHAARKKCSERELLKDAYWKIRRPK